MGSLLFELAGPSDEDESRTASGWILNKSNDSNCITVTKVVCTMSLFVSLPVLVGLE